MTGKLYDKERVSRRDFLGLASLLTVILSSIPVLGGIFRMTKADIHYEESRTFKIGKADEFPMGTVRKLDDKRMFIFSDEDGLYAISSVCTHLGCIVYKTEEGFQCPCHGSKYDRDGKVIAGPAPRPLPWYEISRHLDGNLMVDANMEVERGTRYRVV